MVLGRYGLGALQGAPPWLRYVTIGNSAAMAQLGEFGVVFLLFAIGLELSWERLWTMRRLVFGLGGLQVVTCTAAIATAAMLLGQAPVAAVLLGAALALSSTAIVLPLLAEQKRQFSRPGRAAFAVRARDAGQAQRLYELGVSEAVPETIEASLQLSEALLARLGVPMERLAASIHRRRDEFRRKLAAGDAAQAVAGRPC